MGGGGAIVANALFHPLVMAGHGMKKRGLGRSRVELRSPVSEDR